MGVLSGIISPMKQLSRFLPRPSRLTPGLALFLLLSGWYVLTMSGHTYSSDEETLLAVAESLVESGSFALEPDFLMNYGPSGEDGQRYSRYGPATSLLIVPFLLLGQAVAVMVPPFAEGLTVRLFVMLLPPLITASTALLLYAWLRALAYSQRVSLVVGLLYGLTSLAWPYSRSLFSEPLAALLLVLCAYGIRRESAGWWVLAGAAGAVSLTVKAQMLLALPVLALYALLVGWRGSARASLWPIGGRALLGLTGTVVPLGLLLLYNAHISGNPLTTGYGGVPDDFNTPWQVGLYGLLLSPGRGLLWYMPVLLLGIAGMALRWRQQGREVLLALLLLLLHLVFYSRLDYWHGAGAWGPRYLVPIVPFVLLPAAGLLATLAAWRSRLATGMVGALVAVSFAVQLLPVLVNFNTYIQMRDDYSRNFVLSASPLVGHARLWGERLDEWRLRLLPPEDEGVVVLREGFSYSEGNRAAGEVLPRWTYADAQLQLYPAADERLQVRLVVGDHRPWPLERADFRLLLNGEPLEDVQRTDITGEGVVWELVADLTPAQVGQGALLTLQSDTWNPTRDTEDNPRNEDLGLLLQSVEISQAGEPLHLREALPIPSPSSDRRELWLWYYDTPYHHLIDTWWWYVQAAGLPTGTMLLLLALIGVPALAVFSLGVGGTLATLRRDTPGEPRRAKGHKPPSDVRDQHSAVPPS